MHARRPRPLPAGLLVVPHSLPVPVPPVTLRDEISAAAHTHFPREACGFVLRDGTLVTCTNEAEDPVNTFLIGQAEAGQWWATGQVAGVWHSHPRDTVLPSAEDEARAVAGLDFYVYSVPEEDLALYRPDATGRLQLIRLESPE